MSTEKREDVFSGLTVLAFCWAVVGPLTMKFFADHGATVIRVETTKRPCTLRASGPYKDNVPNLNRGGYFNYYNTNIHSMTLNMELPEAREVARRLALKCDVFMENYTPGNMEKWELDYETLKKERDDIIMLRHGGSDCRYGPPGQDWRRAAARFLAVRDGGVFRGAGSPRLRGERQRTAEN